MEINVDAVVQEIKNDIEREGCVSDIPSFKDVMRIEAPETVSFGEDDLKGMVEAYGSSCYVVESTPIKGNPIVVFIKRLIRKLTRFYVRPIVNAQNDINAMSGRIFVSIEKRIGESGITEYAQLYEKNAVLEMRLKVICDELDAVKRRLLAVEDENRALREQAK